MALTYGFYNSVNGDRKYDADQMSAIYDGVIRDGVFPNVGDIFAVKQSTGMTVTVASGRAWFNRTWTYLDVPMPVTLTAAHPTLPRIDAIVIEVDKRDSVRANFIKVVQGTPATVPQRPAMKNSGDIYQHPLAFITVPKAATAIVQSNIAMVVGQSACPFVTSILETTDIDALFAQWDAQFNEWFENVQSQLEGNVVTNLQMQIDQRLKIASKATLAEVKSGAAVDKWSTPKIIYDAMNDRLGYFAPRLEKLLFTDTRTITSNTKGSTEVARFRALGGSVNDFAKVDVDKDLLFVFTLNNIRAASGTSSSTTYPGYTQLSADTVMANSEQYITSEMRYSSTKLLSVRFDTGESQSVARLGIPTVLYRQDARSGNDNVRVTTFKTLGKMMDDYIGFSLSLENRADIAAPCLAVVYRLDNSGFNTISAAATASVTFQIYQLSTRGAI